MNLDALETAVTSSPGGVGMHTTSPRSMTHPTLRRLGTTTFFFMALLAGAGAQARTDIGVSIGVPGVVV